MTKTFRCRCCLLTAVLSGAVLVGVGCASRTQAEVRAPAPEPLEVPVVPPRSIAAPPPPPANLDVGTADVTKADAVEDATEPATPEPAAPAEGPAPEPAPPPSEEAADAEEDEARLVLRTPETGDDEVTERQVREILRRATRDLGGIDVNQLSDDAKKQYQNAEGFIKQAEAFLKQGNLQQAYLNADKAETLARSLTR